MLRSFANAPSAAAAVAARIPSKPGSSSIDHECGDFVVILDQQCRHVTFRSCARTPTIGNSLLNIESRLVPRDLQPIVASSR